MTDATVRLFSIVMPAFNESAVIATTLDALTGHLDARGIPYEIVVVDDGSTDETGTIVRRYEVRHPAVRYLPSPGPYGFGFAIRHGLSSYGGDAVAIVTSDGSDAPKDVATYFDRMAEGFDCAFGSRFVPGATIRGYPRLKLLMNRLTNRLLSLWLGSTYADYTNGFKCYRRHVIDSLQPLVSGQFNITVELSIGATLGGWKTAIVPTDWTQRKAGSSSFRVWRLALPYAATIAYCLTRHYLRSPRRSTRVGPGDAACDAPSSGPLSA